MRYFKRLIRYTCYGIISSVLISPAALSKWVSPAQSGAAVTLRYCVNPDLFPIEGIDHNLHVGLTKKFIHQLQSAQLKLRFVTTQSTQQTIQFFNRGRCDLLPLASALPKGLQNGALTDTYLTLRLGALTKKMSYPIMPWLEHASYSELISPWQLTGSIVNHLQGSKISVSSIQQGITLVAQRQTDALILPLKSLLDLQKKRHFDADLQVTPLPFYSQYSMLVKQKFQDVIPQIEQQLASTSLPSTLDNNSSYNRVVRLLNDHFWLWIGGLAIVVLFSIYRYYTLAVYSVTLDSKNFELELKNQELLKLQEQLHKRNKKLEYLSTYDMLTALVNRHHFENCVKIELNRHNRNHSDLSLMLLDLDRFKAINDNFGHNVGDKVLVKVADILRQQVRNIDIVGRWGGEEFVILLPNTQLEDAVNLATRICRTIANHKMDGVEHVTCSIGVSQFDDKETMDNVFIKADKALYRAKNLGRNRVECEN